MANSKQISQLLYLEVLDLGRSNADTWNKKRPWEFLKRLAGGEGETAREDAQSSLRAKSRPR